MELIANLSRGKVCFRHILQRIGVKDILENAQKVCTAWRKICKDPCMWRVVRVDNFSEPNEMCKHIVDRSQGQLVDLTLANFGDDELFLYVADRSSQLRRLEIVCCRGRLYNSWRKAFRQFSVLMELSLFETILSGKAIETVGHYCPLLKILKVNIKAGRLLHGVLIDNGIAISIGKHLPDVTHLELNGNTLSYIGLKAIFDGCLQLESLDLRQCFNLKGGIRKMCSNKITYLKLHYDSLEGCPYISGAFNADDASDTSDNEYDIRFRLFVTMILLILRTEKEVYRFMDVIMLKRLRFSILIVVNALF